MQFYFSHRASKGSIRHFDFVLCIAVQTVFQIVFALMVAALDVF
jgi:hypothetical protein